MFFSSMSLLGRIPREIVFSMSSGFYGRTRNCYGLALRRVMHNLLQSFKDRRKRPGVFRRLWITRINAAAREHEMSYSHFLSGLRRGGVELNRRILSTLAETEPMSFRALVDVGTKFFEKGDGKKRDLGGL
jgi:large subunit ribosomal protein L20